MHLELYDTFMETAKRSSRGTSDLQERLPGGFLPPTSHDGVLGLVSCSRRGVLTRDPQGEWNAFFKYPDC